MTRRIAPVLFALIALLLGLAPATPAAPAVAKDPSCDEQKIVRLQSSVAGVAGVGFCAGVRPGGLVQTPIGFCSYNFVFQGTDGYRYIGTAGHCIIESEQVAVGGRGDAVERVWGPGTGPQARDDEGRVFGEFAYAILGDFTDFALIRVHDTSRLNPAMCHFGGPTGMFGDFSGMPVILRHSGNGIGLGDVLPGRTAIALHTLDEHVVDAYGAAIVGDSGGAVIASDGRAVGALVGLTTWPLGPIMITRIPLQLQRASGVMGVGLSLVTAPLV